MAFEILEHTADVGLLAEGPTLEEVFAEAARGMAEIAGAWDPGPGEEVDIATEGGDLGSMLVDWLGEVLYVHDSRNHAIKDVDVSSVAHEGVRGRIQVAPFSVAPTEGVQIKAVTYHQLEVGPSDGGWTARVFFDV